MQIITSKDNEVIKSIRKLKDKKYREIENKYIVEGIKLIREAIEENASIDTVVVCEDCMENGTIDQKLLYEIAKYNCVYVSQKVFSAVTEVTNPQGMLAVINRENKKDDLNYDEDVIVVLDDIQDPGNLGTILRTVDSVGLHQIIVSKGTADTYNPKVVRSTMGAIYRVKVIESDDLVGTLKEIKKHKYKILATSLGAQESIYDVDYERKVIVIGNEANGVSEEILKLADQKIKIPMFRKNRKFKCIGCYKCNFI